MRGKVRVKSEDECVQELRAKHGELIADEFISLLHAGKKIQAIRWLQKHGVNLQE